MKTSLDSKKSTPIILSENEKAKKIDRLKKEWRQNKQDILVSKIIIISILILGIPTLACYFYIGTSNPSPSWGGPFLITMGALTAWGLISDLVKYLRQKKQEKVNKESLSPLKTTPKTTLGDSISYLVLTLISISSMVLLFYLGSLGTPLPEWGNIFLISWASVGTLVGIASLLISIHTINSINKYYKSATKELHIPLKQITA